MMDMKMMKEPMKKGCDVARDKKMTHDQLYNKLKMSCHHNVKKS